MNHPDFSELQEYAFLPRRNELERHLESCSQCRKTLEAIRAFDKILGGIQLETAPPGFTEKVMKRLRISETPTFIWSILQNLAPLFALLFVLATVYIFLRLTGVFEGSQMAQSVETTQTVYKTFANQLAKGISGLNTSLSKLLPFMFAKSSYGLTLFLILFFGAVALLDKFWFLPMMRKRL